MAEEGKAELGTSEFGNIIASLDPKHFKILDAILIKPTSSPQLADLLGCCPDTVKNHYRRLEEFGLIEAKTRTGIKLTPKGMRFMKLCLELVRS